MNRGLPRALRLTALRLTAPLLTALSLTALSLTAPLGCAPDAPPSSAPPTAAPPPSAAPEPPSAPAAPPPIDTPPAPQNTEDDAPAASPPPPPPKAEARPRKRVRSGGVRPRAPLKTETVGGPDFAAVFDAVAPSVVGVVAGQLIDGRFQADRTGTGFAWDSDGHIVTNAHLIGDAPRIRVRTQEGRVTRARLVGLDAATDLAVIDPGALGLPPVALAPVDEVRPGAWVAAVGNPQGMAHSITVGVVSAVGRRSLPPGAPKLAEFIQSDVAVAAGSSGGPLVDTRGRVVGLNTAVVDGKLTFSIRIDMVRTVAERLIADGTFARGFAGLYTGRVTTKMARAAGLKRRRGVRVRGVVEGGPAHAAGLEPGDLLLSYGEHAVDDPEALPWLVAATRPGTAVPLKLIRGVEHRALTLTVGTASQ